MIIYRDYYIIPRLGKVINIEGSIFWKQNPAASRTHALKEKWDALPAHQRRAYEENPALWAIQAMTPAERQEVRQIHERILFEEDLGDAERKALLCRLDYLDPHEAIKRRFDENGERLASTSDWWRAPPSDPTA